MFVCLFGSSALCLTCTYGLIMLIVDKEEGTGHYVGFNNIVYSKSWSIKF